MWQGSIENPAFIIVRELSPDLLREREPSAVYEHRKLSFSTYRQISGFPIRSAFNEFMELVDAYYHNEEFISTEEQFERIVKQLGLYGGGSKFVVLMIEVLRFFYFFYDPSAGIKCGISMRGRYKNKETDFSGFYLSQTMIDMQA